MKTYNQLTDEQRCQIYALNKTGLSQNKIAKQLNVSQYDQGRLLKKEPITDLFPYPSPLK